MTRATDYTNAAQQRLLQLIDLMAGHELQGLTPGEIAKALAVNGSTVTSTPTRPSSVNLRELLTRLKSTCTRRASSPMIFSGMPGSA